MSKIAIQKLEETLAHQEQQIADLSEMLILQGREIAALTREISKLKSKLEMVQDTLEESTGTPLSVTEQAARNKPPHY